VRRKESASEGHPGDTGGERIEKECGGMSKKLKALGRVQRASRLEKTKQMTLTKETRKKKNGDEKKRSYSEGLSRKARYSKRRGKGSMYLVGNTKGWPKKKHSFGKKGGLSKKT